MVLGIFLLAFFVGYMIRAVVRFFARRFSGGARPGKHAEPRPADLGAVDDHVSAWTPLDEVQLTRLLRDSAPKQ